MAYPDKLFAGLSAPTAELIELSRLQGEPYLHACASWLRRELDVFGMSIGELTGADVDELRVLGYAQRGGGPGPASYSLAGTPCGRVMQAHDAVCVTVRAADGYPEDELFQAHGIQSYVGLPLRDGFGRAFGVFCVFDDKPRDDADEILTLLSWLAPRIGNEAGAVRTRRNLANSARWLATSAPRALFEGSTEHLCEVLQVTTTLIMEWPEDEPGSARCLTLLHRGQRRDDLEGLTVSVEGSIFADLRERDTVCINDRARERYPGCRLTRELELESCLMMAVKTSDGRTVGHLAVAHSAPLEQGLEHSPVVALYHSRVAAELTRMLMEHERAEMERALGVKHKLESLGLMAGHIAHDFNNLLMTILGNANLAAELMEPGSRGRQLIENIEAAATSAGDVVSQLLDYAGRKPSRAEALDVSKAVQDASRLVELTRQDTITVNYQLADTLPLVEVDPTQLQQIVINLVLNAAEALDGESGIIDIAVRGATLRPRDIRRLMLGRELSPGEYVEISVSDSGVGIDDATLQRMFDPFFSSKRDGRGLGLAAVRGFVQGAGGGLSIRTELGKGTTVSLFLTHGAAATTSRAPAEPLPAGLKDLTVLVVDDEALVAETAAAMLRGVSAEVDTAGACEEALASVRKRRYHCVLLDIRMPRIDGWTTLKRLREMQENLPAVMMTGYSHEGRAAELVARYGVEVLYKPFGAADLLGVVRRAVSARPVEEAS